MSALIDKTWNELGYKIRANAYRVFVRTEPVEKVSPGGIIYPATESDFYDGPFHLRLVNSTILSVGDRVTGLSPGDRVCFQRKFFVRTAEMQDRTFVGCIHLAEVTAILEPETGVSRFLESPGGPKAVQYKPV